MPEMPVVLAVEVEDEALLQDLVHDTLKDGGFDLVIAASAEEALTCSRAGSLSIRRSLPM